MEYNIDTSSMRYRVRTSKEETTRTYWDWSHYDSNGNRDNGGLIESFPVMGRHVDHMWDIPTKGFTAKSGKGDIINSPMLQEKRIEQYAVYATQENTPLKDGGAYTGSGLEVARAPQFTLDLPERIIDSAVTKAFANVSANESNALLWAGEARESIKMFYDIGKRLYELVRATADQRKAYLKGKLSIKEAQSMTLGLLYGLVPLSEAFEQWRKGLLKILPKGRQTFRGFNTHSDRTSYSYEELIHNWKIDIFVTETIDSNVRAGVLADIDPPPVTVLTLLEPRAVVSTAYALSRLSFVVDWFINVGNWLCSWSPTVGTNILSSWVVIETEQKITARNKWLPVLNDWEKTQSVSGNGTATISLKRKLRIPVSPSNRPYLPSVDVNLNIDKIFALILLFGKTSK